MRICKQKWLSALSLGVVLTLTSAVGAKAGTIAYSFTGGENEPNQARAFTLGFGFTVGSVPGINNQVTALGVFNLGSDGPGLETDHQLAIFDVATQQPVIGSQITIGPNTINGTFTQGDFTYLKLPSFLTLVPGKEYRLGVSYLSTLDNGDDTIGGDKLSIDDLNNFGTTTVETADNPPFTFIPNIDGSLDQNGNPLPQGYSSEPLPGSTDIVFPADATFPDGSTQPFYVVGNVFFGELPEVIIVPEPSLGRGLLVFGLASLLVYQTKKSMHK